MKPVLFWLALAGSLPACATATRTAGWDAVLTGAADPVLRQAIRTFVRDDIGSDYIVEPDALSRGPVMVASDRGRPRGRSRAFDPASYSYRLVTDGRACWLVREGTDVVMVTPATALCERHTA